ncbi:MAG TPA: hypothetical protein VMW50_15090 [Dehalococcoidia bacterium]|nr:hypothetical protein [Dehalococcoidia bacterium]
MSTDSSNVKLVPTNKFCWDKHEVPVHGHVPEHAIVVGRQVFILKQWFNDISKPHSSGLTTEGMWLDVLIGDDFL